jgi:glycosyltransferase involved in cell wall biosynthesis
MPGSEPLITIIVPFKNEAMTLPVILDSLAIQEADFAWEVIFADGCSTDKSVEIIRQHPLSKKAPVSILPLPIDNHGMTVARNAAAKVAKGKYLLFMQADVRIKDSLALTKTRQCLEAPGVVYTSFVLLNADAEFHRYDFWGQVFQSRYVGMREPGACDTKFNAVSKELFEKMHGFDEEHYAWGGEDFDFSTRIQSYGETRDTGVEVEHLHGFGKPFTAKGTFKKYCRNAECMGITAPFYWRHRDIRPWYPRFLAMQLTVCAVAISTLVPFWWPWTILALLVMGMWWNKAAFLRVRNWRLVLLPFYSLAIMYGFTFYYLRGRILGRSSYSFDNKM